MLAEEAVSRVIQEGQSSWGFAAPASTVAQHLERVNVDDEALSACGPDLYLAAACAAGLAPALNVLDREFLSRVPEYVARVCRDAGQIEEIRQDLRVRMLVGPPPRIASYAGAGPLATFLRVAAVRIALNRAASDGSSPLTLDDEALGNATARTLDPEAQALSIEHRQAFQEAIDQALLQLPPRDRAVLRFYFLDGLNIEAIGAIYGVHRATVARWLADIRARLLDAVNARLGHVLGATPSELHSLLNVMRSGLRASLSRLLRKA